MNLNKYRVAALTASIAIAVTAHVAVAAGSSARVTNGPKAAVAASVSIGNGEVVFVPLTPCRLIDTRPSAADAKLVIGTAVPFHAIGSDFSAQGGSASGCGVAADAKAIAVNFTMLNTTAAGDVRMWATNSTMPLAGVGIFNPPGNVFWDGGSAIVPLCQSGCPSNGEFQVYPDNASIDLVLNVTGYFHTAPSATGAGQGLNWGTIARNVLGTATAQLRNDGTAPSGTGSLELNVAGPIYDLSNTKINNGDKVEFGNQVDFVGNPVSGLTAVGYVVKTTQENIDAGGASANMPAIAFEVWTSGTVGVGYSTLNYSPNVNSMANTWSGYIDAVNDPSNAWGLTGPVFNSPATAANCGINGPRCTFAQIKALLTTSPYNAIIISAGISKGRDFAWHGEVDSLRINGTTYDFEAQGVVSIPTP